MAIRDRWREPALRQEKEWRRAAQEMARRPGIVFDMGGGAPYQGCISPEDVGPDTRYFSLDVSLNARPHIVADVTRLPLASSSIDGILCDAVLEHVREPQQAVDEMRRVLKKRARMMAAVPFFYPYHDAIDFYRFTDTALEHIFRRFEDLRIVAVGDYVYTSFLFFTGFNFRLVKWLSPLLHFFRAMLYMVLSLYCALVPPEKRRDYLKSFSKSPLGWYVCCRK